MISISDYVPDGNPSTKTNTSNSRTTSAFMVHGLLAKELVKK